MSTIQYEIATRKIVGRVMSNSPAPAGYDYMDITETEAAKIYSGGTRQDYATVSVDGLVTVVLLPIPTQRTATDNDLQGIWTTADQALSTDLDTYNTAKTSYTGTRAALNGAAAQLAAARAQVVASTTQAQLKTALIAVVDATANMNAFAALEALANAAQAERDAIGATNDKIEATAEGARILARRLVANT